MGMVYSELGEWRRALEYYERGLLLHRAVSFRRGEADTLTARGDLHLALNELPKALADYESALSINRSVSHLHGQINDLLQLGAVRIALGETQRAFESLNDAFQLAHSNGMEIQKTAILYQLARAERQANHPAEGVARIRAATDSIEHVRGDIAGSALRASYLANVRKTYELLMDLLWQIHRQHPREGFDSQALEASERAHARGLLAMNLPK